MKYIIKEDGDMVNSEGNVFKVSKGNPVFIGENVYITKDDMEETVKLDLKETLNG